MSDPILDVRDLSVRFGPVEVLDRVSLRVHRGEVVGLVGESGSGKSTLIGAVSRTLGEPAAITSGEAWLAGRDVLGMSDAEVRATRWRDVSLVPQSALDALNPVLTVRRQLVDTMRAHRPEWTVAACDARGLGLLQQVGIGAEHYRAYPHELSGGTRQRVAIALALALDAPLMVLDEPTTALDVVVQRRILARLLALRRARDFAMVFVTHDLPMLLSFADRLVVLYAGRVVEEGPTADVRTDPRHPYTRGLLASLNPLTGPRRALFSIPGTPPSPADPPAGCRFHPRCSESIARCRERVPALQGSDGRRAACHLLDGASS